MMKYAFYILVEVVSIDAGHTLDVIMAAAK